MNERRVIKDVKCVVVGGAGFLGSHAVDHLINDRGCEVLVIDNLAAGKLEFVNKAAKFEHHDITGSENYLIGMFKSFGAKVVLNFAALPYVPTSYERPLRVFDVNAFGAMKVINASQQAGCEAVLQVSSAELYGDGLGLIDELVDVRPHSSYGASKAAVDWFVQCAWRERRTPVIALRQFNCCGERETHDYVIPTIISQLSQQRPVGMCRDCGGDGLIHFTVHKSHDPTCPACNGTGQIKGVNSVKLGNNTNRDFLYVGDAVRMAVELLEEGDFGEVYNSGSQETIAVYDLAKKIGSLMGFEEVAVTPDESRMRPWDIWHLRSNNGKLYQTIEYRPQVGFDEALSRTIKWYESNNRRWPWEK